ncbi:MAG: LptA/OstA family protein [Methylacidiphilaceae bacterium]|nr:LptA/OstA family protein [Candidatus Methylacidiphilaceae bacterium]
MKPFFPFFACLLLVSLSTSELRGQFPEGKPSELQGHPDATVVTSNTFRLDMNIHQGFFNGNVILVTNNMRMRSNEMTVFFDETGNQVKRMIARGDAILEQTTRTGKSSQMEYIVAENKLIMTGNPEVIDEKNHVTGTVITLFRDTDQMQVDGHSKVVLYQGQSAGQPSPPPAQPR